MNITRNFSKYAVFSEDSILVALNKLTANGVGIVVAVTEGGYVEGLLSQGDVRRWLIETERADLGRPVVEIVNRTFYSAHVDANPAEIRGKFSETVSVVPLLDDNGRLTAVATAATGFLEIAGRRIGDNHPTFVIAEIGNNHQGDLDHARRLIDAAAAAGADCAKFQMRDLGALYAGRRDGDVSADLGAQYTLDLLDRFQLSDDDLMRAFDHCLDRGLTPLCTPWEAASLAKLEAYGLPGFKIASADFTNHDLLEAVAACGKPMLCSTGMASEDEIVEGVRKLKGLGCPFALLHCNSTYPAPFKDVRLRYMRHLRTLSGGVVGYSGHERDVNVAIAAVSLGARIIEKHFTFDRGQEGNDHKVSLLPEEFARMVEGVRQVEEALGDAAPRVISQGEMMNRETLAKSLAAAVDIPAGVPIEASMLTIHSPGQGLQPNRKAALLGRRLAAPKKAGDFFFESDLTERRATARPYRFPLPWGVPVRYHDFARLAAMSTPDLVEIHLSYKDLDVDFRKFIPGPTSLGLVVHAPELFAGDHTLDLCAADKGYRTRSIAELQRVIDITRALTAVFATPRPCIVTNVGGFSNNRHTDAAERRAALSTLRDSLAALDAQGVEIIPQTMPPFPWHFGGQQFHNLFVTPDDIAGFCAETGMRICLDTSHSQLACAHLGLSFEEFLRATAPHVAHMHLADARGVDGEGVQIGEGDIDWPGFWRVIRETGVTASFIPEIWQGHKNDGEGAWLALERLEAHAAA